MMKHSLNRASSLCLRYTDCVAPNIFGPNLQSRKATHWANMGWYPLHGISESLKRIKLSVAPKYLFSKGDF